MTTGMDFLVVLVVYALCTFWASYLFGSRQ
jgi:hypothetical protein